MEINSKIFILIVLFLFMMIILFFYKFLKYFKKKNVSKINKSKLLRKESYDSELSSLDDDDCIICLNKIDFSKDDFIILSCNHYYHQNCIESWFKYKKDNRCPICDEITKS